MALSVVQNTSTTGTSTSLQLASLTTTAGNLFVIAVVVQSGITISSVADSASNTWASAVSDTTQTPTYIYATTNAAPAAITSVTVTPSASSSTIMWFYEISGAVNANAIDSSAHTSGSSSAPNSGSTAPIGTAILAIGSIGWTSNTITASSVNFTSSGSTNHTTTAGTGGNQVRISTSSLVLPTPAAAQAYSATLSSTSTWGAAIAMIKSQGVGTSGGTKHLVVGDGMGRSEMAN